MLHFYYEPISTNYSHLYDLTDTLGELSWELEIVVMTQVLGKGRYVVHLHTTHLTRLFRAAE